MRETQHEGVNWLKLFEIFWVDEIPLKGITLVEPIDANKYNWVDSEILGTLYILSDPATKSVTNIKIRLSF